MKKKYNPFKMWGSWIGGIFILWLWSGDVGSVVSNLFFTEPGNLIDTIYFKSHFFGFLLELTLNFLLGFLIGWGINSFFRSRRRR